MTSAASPTPSPPSPAPGEFRMPSLGADMQFGTVVAWNVAPGETVTKGDVVVEVETEKGVFEVESSESGVVDELVVPKGTKVPVGTVIARLRSAAPGGALASPTAEGDAARAAAPTVAAAATPAGTEAPAPASAPAGASPEAPEERRAPAAASAPAPQPVPPLRHGTRASPLARRIAEAAGIDVSTIAGTGPDGAITKDDVERVLAAARASAPAAAGGAAAPPIPVVAPAATPPAAPTAVPVAAPAPTVAMAMRQAVAAAVSRSKREIPHYYLGTDIDMSAALAWLRKDNERRPISARILPAALLLKSVALALTSFPALNGFWTDGTFRTGGGIHLGIAISLRGGGLIAPAIHDVDRLALGELMSALGDLVRRARGGGLRGSEMTDATITISNLGDEGVQLLFGVIYPPQVALVGFGRIAERPWASGGLLGVRPVVTATLSADHRATDGHYGARFLAEIERLLQTPESL